MRILIEFDDRETTDDVNNLNLASAIYEVCKTFRPDIDIAVVGHLLQSQAEHDNRVKDYGKYESRMKG